MSDPTTAAPPSMPVTVIRADLLAPRLREILNDLDAWYGQTQTHRGSESRIDRIADGIHDLLCEVLE